MKKIKLLFVALLSLCLGCNDFFEEESQNQAYVTTMRDLDELLVGEAYIQADGFFPGNMNDVSLMLSTYLYFPWIHMLDDDIVHVAGGSMWTGAPSVSMRTVAAYGWQSNPFLDEKFSEYAPDDWRNAYKRIAVTNSIISELDELGAKEPDKRFCNRVTGEAYFLRAWNYFWLVNIYAQPYAVETASEEPGVPLKISELVEDKHFSRSSVQAVYRQIVQDLQRSITAFSGAEENERPVRANFASACLLMSRVCLYMEDYAGAIAYADSVIQRGKYAFLDLNGKKAGEDFTYEASPETIFTQGGFIVGLVTHRNVYSPKINTYACSPDLLESYMMDDLRREFFFINSGSADSRRCLKLRTNTVGRIGDYLLMRLPEVYLNKAEAEAILGDEAGAKATLNSLREKRFVAGEMPTIEEDMKFHGNKDLVSFVRDERRRELCFEGQRWFDLRRYAVNSKYPFSNAIRHPVKQWQGGADGRYVTVGYYELKPYAEDRATYVFPLPFDEIIFNEGVLVQNAARPEREIIPY